MPNMTMEEIIEERKQSAKRLNDGPTALEPCPACNREISSKARHCPGCGQPFKREFSTSGFTLFGAVVCGMAVITFFILASTEQTPDFLFLSTLNSFGLGMLLIAIGGIITLLRELVSRL